MKLAQNALFQYTSYNYFVSTMVQYFVYTKGEIYDVFYGTLRCTFVAVLAAKFSHVSLIVFNHFSFHKMEFIGCKKTNFYNWTNKCLALQWVLCPSIVQRSLKTCLFFPDFGSFLNLDGFGATRSILLFSAKKKCFSLYQV